MEKLPRIRTDIQLLPGEVRGERVVALKDMLGLNEAVVALRPQVIHFLPLFDGEHSVLDLQEAMTRLNGNRLVMRSEAERLVEDLDRLLMLDSEVYRARKRQVRQQFAALPNRPAALAGSGYPEDPTEARELVKGILSEAGPMEPVPGIRALIAPHIDLRVGRELYGKAYVRLADCEFGRLLVLGTGHSLDDGLFSVSPKRYETPVGSFPADTEAAERLTRAGSGCLAPDDFAHRTEHSIEFQMLFLRTVLQRDIPAVSILVGGLGDQLAVRGDLAEIPGVGKFLDALRDLCGEGTLVVAGVDFCHVGPKFGHPESAVVYEPDFRDHDRRLLDAICHGSARELWAEAQRVQDRFHVCGLATLMTVLEILPGATGQVLGYDVWHEQPTRSAVSFAAALLQ